VQDDKAGCRFFSDLEEAAASVNHVIYLEDFEHPENVGHGLFVHRHDQAETLNFPDMKLQVS
jgi:hypothetical protein